jgi:beta-glucosidase
VQPGDRAPKLSVTVTNTGSRPSREVVQVYFRPLSADQPTRLVGWTSVTAAAGQSLRAEVQTEPRMWRRWDPTAGGWVKIGGGGKLLVARGLGDIRASIEVAD